MEMSQNKFCPIHGEAKAFFLENVYRDPAEAIAFGEGGVIGKICLLCTKARRPAYTKLDLIWTATKMENKIDVTHYYHPKISREDAKILIENGHFLKGEGWMEENGQN